MKIATLAAIAALTVSASAAFADRPTLTEPVVDPSLLESTTIGAIVTPKNQHRYGLNPKKEVEVTTFKRPEPGTYSPRDRNPLGRGS